MALVRRTDIKYLALEALIVLFGVLAALLVERAREERALTASADVALERVESEVRHNLEQIEDLRVVVERRLALLRSLRTERATGSLSELASRFEGYRTPDLSRAAWDRLSGSDLADAIDPGLMLEGFHVYEWNRQFDLLDVEINRLVYSELYYDPSRLAVAIAISERIMGQQLSWARAAAPELQAFLAAAQSG